MADVISINIRSVQPSVEDLKKVFTFVKKHTDQILADYNGACFSKAPFVDVRAIATKVGISEIKPVPPEEINYEHARLRGTVILVNREDSPEEQHFSIAHEICHFIFTGKEAARSVTNPQFDIWEKQGKNADEIFSEQLAQASSKELGIIIKGHIGKPISVKAEKIVYEKIGKVIFEIMGENIAKLKGKTITNKTNISIFEKIKAAFYKVIKETVEEELADYFAANLVVPTERFVLWEDKPDEEIARAFGVTRECIKKRREEEIEHELNLMTPRNLSSAVEAEEEAPASLDELDGVLEDYFLHDNRGV
jgi:Zn-dependent peptidase ImmA (M78 family)